MELFGLPLETLYLYTLFIAGVLTLLLILFNDILSIFDAPDYLNPVIILSFLTIFSASGYIFEMTTSLNSVISGILSGGIALVSVIILNIFILIPLSSAEASLSYVESDLKGRIGKVLTTVPIDGYGEVLIEGTSGSIAKPAVSFDNEAIPSTTKVLVIDVQKGVLYVIPHQQIEETI